MVKLEKANIENALNMNRRIEVFLQLLNISLETHSRIFQKCACISPICHAVALLAASN